MKNKGVQNSRARQEVNAVAVQYVAAMSCERGAEENHRLNIRVKAT